MVNSAEGDKGLSNIITIVLVVVFTSIVILAIVLFTQVGHMGQADTTVQLEMKQFPDNDQNNQGDYRVEVQMLSSNNIQYVSLETQGSVSGAKDLDGDGKATEFYSAGSVVTVHDLEPGEKINVYAISDGSREQVRTFTTRD